MKKFLLLLALIFAVMISYSQKKPDLFIWEGQSNAHGWMGDSVDYPAEEKELDESILLNRTFVDKQHQFVKERPLVAGAERKLADKDTNIVFTSMVGLPKADVTHFPRQVW